MRKTKNSDFVLKHVSTVRAVCLKNHISNVGAVLAYLIKYGDAKNLDFTNALKKYNDEDFSKIIFEMKLNAYNNFFISWNDIKKHIGKNDFDALCFANNLDANYIKGV